MEPEWVTLITARHLEQNNKSTIGDKQMKKSDLVTGMVVKRRDGRLRTVMLNCSRRGADNVDMLIGKQDSGALEAHNDDLTHNYAKKADIVAVYEALGWQCSLTHVNLNPLWERKEETPAQKEKKAIEAEMRDLAERLEALEVD